MTDRSTSKPSDVASRRAAWEKERLEPALGRAPERKPSFSTISDMPIDGLYGPWSLPTTPTSASACPGDPPFTRGIHPTGYRSRLWTMRMFAGFGAAEDTNARFHQLLAAGQTGLSIAYDMPTLYGYDTDDAEAEGEFGTCGVAVSSLADMEVLLDGLPLERVSTSMTINSPAAPIWAMYIVAAEKAGVPRARLEGTTQNDILKEFIAQKEFLFPPEPSMRLVTDTIEFGTREMPRWNTISISGYHIREAGSTAVQELAFTIADGMAYVEAALERGLRVDDFAPRLSFFFNSHSDFFEEIAKFRASRRIWHNLMTKRYGAENERSAWMRFHTQTAGVSLTPQQPLNNLTRVALQALAGGPGRHPVAPHRRLRRGAGRADRRSRAARPPPAADHRRGERGRRDGRSARRFVVRRGADRRDRAPGVALHRRDRRGGAGWSPRSRRASRSARSPMPRTASSASSTPGSGGSSASTPTSTRTRRRACRCSRCRRDRWSGIWRDWSARVASGTRPRWRRRWRIAGCGRAAGDAATTNLMPHFIRCAEAYATLGEQCARPARRLRGVPRARRCLRPRAAVYHGAMYLDAMEFLEEERDAWAPYEALAGLTDEQLSAAVDAAHGWSGRELMAHLLAWQEVALRAAKELAVNETSETFARVDADWDARGGEVVNAEIDATWARRADGRAPRSVRDAARRAARLPDGRPRDALAQARQEPRVVSRRRRSSTTRITPTTWRRSSPRRATGDPARGARRGGRAIRARCARRQRPTTDR